MSEPRRVVCNRCNVVIDDDEPATALGRYWHPVVGGRRPCRNEGRYLDLPADCRPFERKRERRRARRDAVRANQRRARQEALWSTIK